MFYILSGASVIYKTCVIWYRREIFVQYERYIIC